MKLQRPNLHCHVCWSLPTHKRVPRFEVFMFCCSQHACGVLLLGAFWDKKTQEKHPWSKHGTTMSENESMVTTKWHFTYSLIPRVVSRHNKMLSFKQTKLALWSLFFFSFGSKNSVHQILESNTDGTFCNQTMQLCTFAKPFVIIFKIFPCDKSLVTQSVNIHLLFSGYSFNVILLHKCFRNA